MGYRLGGTPEGAGADTNGDAETYAALAGGGSPVIGGLVVWVGLSRRSASKAARGKPHEHPEHAGPVIRGAGRSRLRYNPLDILG